MNAKASLRDAQCSRSSSSCSIWGNSASAQAADRDPAGSLEEHSKTFACATAALFAWRFHPFELLTTQTQLKQPRDNNLVNARYQLRIAKAQLEQLSWRDQVTTTPTFFP